MSEPIITTRKDGTQHVSWGPADPTLHRTTPLPSSRPCATEGCTGFVSASRESRYCPEHRRAAHRGKVAAITDEQPLREAQRARWERLWLDAEAAARGAFAAAQGNNLVMNPSTAYFAAAGAMGSAWLKVRDQEFGAWLRLHKDAETDPYTGGARLAAPDGPLDKQRAWVEAFAQVLMLHGIRAYPDFRLG